MLQRHARRSDAAPFDVRLARSAAEVLRAQRLRFEIFALEMGARVSGAAAGLDRDRFDDGCDHLLVVERTSDRVVGTCRMLPPERRDRTGGWYCEGEFDVRRLLDVRGRIVEIGRACVAPDHRNGLVIATLWGGLLRYLWAQRADYVIGCASIETGDGGHIAASVCRRLLSEHLAPPAWRVVPRTAFALEGWREVADAPLPSLLKGYLRLGAQVCGPPAWDAAFRSADVLMRLAVADVDGRYVERLSRAA
jgi:putative hemolysin